MELYLHIPFCVRKCEYCAFISFPASAEEKNAYVSTLLREAEMRRSEATEPIETVYIGGGTPSLLSSEQFRRMISGIRRLFPVTAGAEFSMEANPESLDERLVKDMWALGVNRLSIGVQSFDDTVLGILGRAHDSQGALRAIEAAQSRFENVSIDLMCGIPGQSTQSFEQSLEKAISLGIKHVSVYPLTIEPHTAFDRAVLSGQMDEPDDDVEAEHMLAARRALEKAGFERYEVASYAIPGFESRHNTSYWTGVPYIGLGENATTMTQNDERRMRVCNGQVVDDLDRRQMEAEDLMLGMRMARGVSDERILEATRYVDGVLEALESLQEDGLAVHDGSRWKPTEKGWLCGNELYGRLLDLAP